MSDAEVPSADALDQDRPVDPHAPDDDLPQEIPGDVPAAAYEQARELPLDDDARDWAPALGPDPTRQNVVRVVAVASHGATEHLPY